MPAPRRRPSAPTGAVRADATLDDVVGGSSVPPVVVLLGDEELLVSRATATIVATVRTAEPAVEVSERAGALLDAAEVAELLSPSLFGDRRVVTISSAQDIRVDVMKVLAPFVADPEPSITLVLQHPGGAKGKAVLEAARSARAPFVACLAPTRPEERAEFVRAEVRRAGGVITADAAAQLVEAIGSDLRELSTVATQLASDCDGRVDAGAVAAYHRGRAEVTGFAVADLAVIGKVGEALETLRWALSIGVPAVLLADALAEGVRSVARVVDDIRGNPNELAPRLGMPPWKVRRAQGQARTWQESTLRQALQEVATLNADVKGEAVDAGYALEHAVRRVAVLARPQRA